MAAKFPKGSEMQVDTATAAPATFETIPGVRSISLAGLTAEQLDTTSHDTASGFRDKIQGLKDWGTVSFELLWDPSLATHAQLFDDFKTGKERQYQIVINSQGAEVATFAFTGFVQNYPFQVPFDALLTASVELAIKGDPEPTLTPAGP